MKTNVIFIFLSLLIILSDQIQAQSSFDLNYVHTVFHDDFQGPTLDNSIWTATHNYIRSDGVLKDSTATINLNAATGNLELTMVECSPFTNDDGKTVTYAGGEISTLNNPDYHFKYGIFECRAKFADGDGSWPAFWIIGSNGQPRDTNNPGYHFANEIDIAEFFCGTGSDFSFEHNIHHYHDCSTCNYSERVDHKTSNHQINNSYHLYKCIWTPSKIEYYIDNNLVHTVNENGQKCPECNSEWFPQYELRLILSQQITDRASTKIAPQTSYFDYIDVKQFFDAPEITCPDVICSTTTATLDVDEAAPILPGHYLRDILLAAVYQVPEKQPLLSQAARSMEKAK